MNSSVYSADRATYLRIVIVALLASIAIVGFAISARISDDRSVQAMNSAYIWKAELPNHNAAVTARPQRSAPDLTRRRQSRIRRAAGRVDADQHVRGLAV